MFFKKILPLLGLLTAGPLARAQSVPVPDARVCAVISGVVTGNEKPLAGVSVTVPGTRLLTITNSEGFFTLTLNNVAQPRLDFSAAGYEPQTLDVASCVPLAVELRLLPGTRIKQRGKRKGFIMKTGSAASAQ